MTTRKRIVFAALAATSTTAGSAGILIAADVRLHHKLERAAGVNIWGYRGPTVRRKERGEHRLVVVGGSTAFGYGLNWDQAFPAQLENDLRPLSTGGARVTVVNLGFNAQGAYAFQPALEDYERLDYDAAILYEGYNDVNAPNEFVGRRHSLVFRMTGYFPILATAMQEKAMLLRYGGDLDAAYRGTTVFKPSLAARTTAGALSAAAEVGRTLHDQLERFSTTPRSPRSFEQVRVPDLGCGMVTAHYCASMDRALRFLIDRHKKALVVTQPYISEGHRNQQARLREMLAARYSGNHDVEYADLGDAVDMHNTVLSYDTMHLTAEGNGVIARQLVPAVARLMPEAFQAPSTRAH